MFSMTSQELGSSFEIITEEFFLFLFDQIEIQVNNNWVQKAGYQFGFDVGFEVAILNDKFFKRSIYIECKNYKKSILEQSQLHTKLMQFHRSDYEKKDSIFIFLSPKVDLSKCTQDSNPKQLEDYFNTIGQFNTIILTPNNKIKDIFSLHERIFSEVYNEIFTELDEDYKEIILTYFKKLLFSKGEIPNFTESKQRKEYLEEASTINTSIYINRKLKTNKFSFFNEDKDLLDIIKDKDIVLLLGEPGSGKTTELINISNYFEKNILELEITPIFISLSNVKSFDSINDVLPENWKLNKKIVLLLDALDEFEFRNQLNKEIKNLLECKDTSFKIIVSSRTYAYNNELNLLNPTKFYLDNFNSVQSFELLSKKYQIPIEQYNQIDKINFKDVLEDPFMLNRLGKYFENHDNLPNNPSEIYEDIKSELSNDDIEVYKIFSLILELTRKTSIDKVELKNLFGVKYNRLVKLDFIQSSFDNNSFKFIHKNYQEYFSALAISELSFEQIISFISIEGTNKTHPTLFNTITFLINILRGNKYNLLINWLTTNESEILFKADKNRIENFRVKVFQHYFQIECIEKKFWINSNRTFSVKEIAEFGDCEANFDYLVDLINDSNNHFRIIISALDLLTYFTIPVNKKETFKDNFFILLKNSQNSEMIKSHILDCIYGQKLCEDDTEYLNKIFVLFRDETNKQINRSLLSLIQDYENIDDFFWYVKAEFLRDRGIVERAVRDDVLRGTSWVLERLIIKLKSSVNFIEFAKYYFDEFKNNYRDNQFVDEVVDRSLYFENLDEDFLVKLFSSFEDKAKYFFRENPMKKMLLKSKSTSKLKAFEYLIENFTFDNVGYFLASITDEQTIGLVIDKFANGSIESKNLDFYRNVIANHGNRKLAEKFNNVMIEKGFVFKEVFLNPEDFEELIAKYKNRPQEDFDLLFDKTKLLSKINEIFEEYGMSINSTRIRDIDQDWYHKNGYGNKIELSYSLLSSIAYRKKIDLEFKDIEHILEDELIIIKEVKSQIQALNNSNNFEISTQQKAFIYDWCVKASDEIRFDKVIGYIDINHFKLLEDYDKLKVILFFITKFNFDLSQEFFLNSIEFFDVNKSSEEGNNLELLKLKIDDDELFNKRIIENLLGKKLPFIALNIHIQYALDNNLTSTFSKIKEYFLVDEYSFNVDSKLKRYIELSSDIELLKKLCIDVKSYKCWSSLKLLMDFKIENKFCEEKAIEYLNTEIDDENNYYYSTALSILFELNSPLALKHVFLFLDMDKSPSINYNSYVNFDVIDDYSILNDLFNKIYSEDRDKIGFSGLGDFMRTYVSNLSKKKESHDLIQAELNNIKNRVEKINSDNELFYINQLIDDSKKSYLNVQSKSLSFDEALLKLEEIFA